MAGPRVLIAGCGELGLKIADRLARRGCGVWGLRRRWADPPRFLTPVAADLLRPETLADLPATDAMVYCATPDGRDETRYRQVFVDGLSNLLAALPERSGRLLFVSSTAVYGQDDGSWVDEESATEPGGFNGAVLLEAEAVARASGWTACALRLGGIYGPGRTWLIRRALSDEATCQGDPPRWTNRIHIDDAARMAAHLLSRQDLPAVVNGVDPAPTPECEVLGWIAERLGRPAPRRVSGAGAAKRVRCGVLGPDEFRFLYPSFREGYAALLDDGLPVGPG